MNIWTVLKSFLKINYLIGVNVLVLSKVNALVKKIIYMLIMLGMGNYHHFYLKADVLILPDVFEKFIDTCSEYYRLDLYDYVSSFRLI